MNHFDLLGLAQKYDLDLSELKKQYFLMQAKYHPDRAKEPGEKKQALEISMQLNEAYKILQDDYLRAEYLLKLKGQKFDDQILKNVLPVEELEEFLSEFEVIEETSSRLTLEKMENTKLEEKAVLVAEITQRFAENKLNEALDLTVRLKYLTNLVGNIKAKLKHANN
jgi:molecular chaperone HscB